MSKQLILSAALSVLAMATLALVMGFGGSDGGNGTHAATAHGSIASVLLRA